MKAYRPPCKQRNHYKHSFSSVGPGVPPVGPKDQPSLRILLERSHHHKDQSKFFRFVATNCWKMIVWHRSRSAFYWWEKWTFNLQYKSKSRSSWLSTVERQEGRTGQQDLDTCQHPCQRLWLKQVPGCQVIEDMKQDSFKLEEKLFFFLAGAALTGCALPTQNVFLMTETTETTEITPEPPALLSVSSSFPSLLFTNSKKLLALLYRL